MTTENTTNKLFWQSDLYPGGQVEVQLTLATYANNDNLYAGLIAYRNNEEEDWEPFTDLTINQHSLPPFYAYVDNRDYNKGAHEFLVRHEIAEPSNLFPEWNGFKLFRFNRKKLEELAPEYYKVIARKLPPGQKALETIEYKKDSYPLRQIKDTYGFYIISVPELKKALLRGIDQADAEAEEIHESICHYCTEEDLKYLTDEEMIEIINNETKENPIMKAGDIATLICPYKGYRTVELIEKLGNRWLVRICESGLELEVYEDEFTLD